MFDQSYSHDSIRRCVRRIDFFLHPTLRMKQELETQTALAETILHNNSWNTQIQYQPLKGKRIAIAQSYASKLALRRVSRNLRQAIRVQSGDRELIVRALATILREGVPFRLFKLDVRSFYESFEHDYVKDKLRFSAVSNGTRRVVSELLQNHRAAGLPGLPRGLAVSAALTELLMSEFDEFVHSHRDVFFYRRFVDDITIVTSKREDPAEFRKFLADNLPQGLEFKRSKTSQLETKRISDKDIKPGNSPLFEQFDYLGYSFNVAIDKHQPQPILPRKVWLDVAIGKVKRIKTRIIRSYLDFLSTGDFSLLDRRIRHLTSNMSLLDRGRGIRRLIGIRFNYPLVSYKNSESLRELDRFLKNSLHSTNGSIYQRLSKKLTPAQKALLAKHSFYAGAKAPHFFQMSVRDLGEIQRCWKYAK